MKELYIVRHGETVENKDEVIQGQLDGTLTERGIEQARSLGSNLRDAGIDFDVIITSPLRRAYDTALEVARFVRAVPIIPVDALKEINFGEWQGRTVEEMVRAYGKEFNRGDSALVEAELYSLDKEDAKIAQTWEPLYQFRGRAESVLEGIVQNPDYHSALVSGHGWINTCIANILLNEGWVWHDQANANVHYFKVNDRKVLAYQLDINPKDLKTGREYQKT